VRLVGETDRRCAEGQLAAQRHRPCDLPVDARAAEDIAEAALQALERLVPELVRTAWAGDELRTELATVAAPLPGEGVPLGVLECHLADPAAADDDALLRAAAAQLGQALDRARLLEELERRAYHDDLTGLPNRALLRDRFAVARARAARSGEALAVLVVDVDGFKDVNDRFGHGEGDRVLADLAGRIACCVRPGDTVARLGGDEFAVLCEAVDARTAARVADRIAAAATIELPAPEVPVRLGASVGVARWSPTDGDADPELDDLLHRADLAMYERKRVRGR